MSSELWTNNEEMSKGMLLKQLRELFKIAVQFMICILCTCKLNDTVDFFNKPIPVCILGHKILWKMQTHWLVVNFHS